jgi:hypothetical protein
MSHELTTVFEIGNPTGKPVESLTVGLETCAKIAINTFYANPQNQYKKLEVVLMPSDVANDVRKYLARPKEGGHHA